MKFSKIEILLICLFIIIIATVSYLVNFINVEGVRCLSNPIQYQLDAMFTQTHKPTYCSCNQANSNTLVYGPSDELFKIE